MVVLARQRVVCANDCAREFGIKAGMSTSTVHALLGDTGHRVLERDIAAEASSLQHLQAWAYSITPALECWQQDCLQLEISGCLTLFGGLERLVNTAIQDLQRRGFEVSIGVAPTRRAAWLLSHSELALATAVEAPLEDRISDLTLDYLEEFPKAVTDLHRAGIHTFGDLLKLPAHSLGKRCGAPFQYWLEQMLGTRAEAAIHYQPPPAFQDALWFGFEIRNQQELHPAMQDLLQRLSAFLRNTQLNTQNIEWQMLRMRGTPLKLPIHSSTAQLNWQVWLELSKLRLEQQQLPDNVEGLGLSVTEFDALSQLDDDLFNTARNKEPLHQLTDRFRSRLGLQAVKQLSLREEHIPEQSCYQDSGTVVQRSQSNAHSGSSVLSNQPAGQQRPFWLFAEPQPARKEGEQLYWNGKLKLIYGPERIEDGWWQPAPVSRDYYIAQGADGQPLWVFEDRRNRCWFVHGVFA